MRISDWSSDVCSSDLATNHGYDAHEFLRALPSTRIRYIHVAGHRDEAPDLKIDTHGADVSDPVWALLAEAYRVHGRRPTLLERDFNFPPFAALAAELISVRRTIASERSSAARRLTGEGGLGTDHLAGLTDYQKQ